MSETAMSETADTALKTLAALDQRRQAIAVEADRLDAALDQLRLKMREARKLEDDARAAKERAWDEEFLAQKKVEGATDQVAKSSANLATAELSAQYEECVRLRKSIERAQDDKTQTIKTLRSEQETLRAECFVLNSEVKNLGG